MLSRHRRVRAVLFQITASPYEPVATRGEPIGPEVRSLVVLHKSLAIDFRRAYDLRLVCGCGSSLLLVCDRGLSLLLVCDRCSSQRGSDMSALRHEGVGKEEEKVTNF